MSEDLVLGFGGCVDYEVEWESAAIERHAVELGIHRHEIDASTPVLDERSLLLSILGFMNVGSGGERHIASSQIGIGFAQRHRFRPSLGGTNVRAALALAQIGIGSVVHVVNDSDLARMLYPQRLEILNSGTLDSLHPHLIVQYPAGATIQLPDGAVTAKHANRIIYVNDPPNVELRLHPQLPAVLSRAGVLLMSGFNAIDDPQRVRERADELRTAIENLPPAAIVYYEDAAFHSSEVRTEVTREFKGLADVHGMNEDEVQSYLGRQVDLLEPAEVAAAVRELRTGGYLLAPTLVVHTKRWALAHGPLAARLRPSLRRGIDFASSRYLYGDDLSVATLRQVESLPRQAAAMLTAAATEEALEDCVCIAARQLEVQRPTTIGLGDTFVAGFLAALADQRAEPGLR